MVAPSHRRSPRPSPRHRCSPPAAAASGHADAHLVHQPRPESPGRVHGAPSARRASPSGAAPTSYTVKTELLPQSATEQRIQLLRRLVAKDSSISLMSLDPVFTAEFAAAGFLEPLPDDLASPLSKDDLKGAIEGATWDDKLVAAPLWANTQMLWFRKSLARARPAST